MLTSLKWCLYVSCAALLLPLVPPLLTGSIFVTGDLQAFHLPYRYIYQQALAAGDSLLWTPSIFAGTYVHGEGQAGLLHPAHLLLYGFFPLRIAFNLELLANYVLAIPGMYLFLRRLDLEDAPALFGAMLFTFSGFALLHHEHLNMIALVAHIPWLLLAADLVLAAISRAALARAYAALVGVMVSALLLGFPQGVWWNLATVGAFALFRAHRTNHLARLAPVAGGIATGLVIAAVQLLPTLDVSSRSIRGLLTRAFALSFSLHPLNVLQLWSPYVFTQRVYSVRDVPLPKEFGIYSGAILLVSLAWLWIRRRELRQRRTLIAAALLFAGLNFVLALGYYGGLHTALTYLPLLESIRAPVRYIVLVDFALVVIAAIVFQDVLSVVRAGVRLDWSRLRPLWIPAALSLITTLALNTRILPVARDLPLSSAGRAMLGTIVVLAVTATVALAARGRRWAMAALVVVTAADLASWGVREVWREPPQTIESLYAAAEPPLDPSGRETLYKSTFDFPGNILVLRGYRLSSGYTALPPATYFHVSSPIALQLSGTIWDYTPNGRQPLAGAVSRARMLAAGRLTGAFGRDFALVDHHDTALLDREVPPLAGPPGTARILVDRAGDISVETSAPGRQLLALTERFHPGWHATVDGQRVETLAIHGDFVGALVEAGTHRVDFRFMPRSFVWGAATSGIGVLVFVLTLVGLVRRPAKVAGPAGSQMGRG